MPRIAPVSTLVLKLIDFIADRIDLYFRHYYNHRLRFYKYEKRPLEGPFAETPNCILFEIITNLVKRRRLQLKHLLVLLPHNGEAFDLTCDHLRGCTAYKAHMLELIVTRCPILEEIHYHAYRGPNDMQVRTVNTLNQSIPHFFNLKHINLHDSNIGDETLRVISLNCSCLESLDVRSTEITDLGIRYLLENRGNFQNSLTALIIEYTNISVLSVANIYMRLPNLTYFLNDLSIHAGIMLLETQFPYSSTYGIPFETKTTILKGDFGSWRFEFPSEEIFRSFVFMFLNVTILSLINIKVADMEVVNKLISHLKKVDTLELSAEVSRRKLCPFNMLKPSIGLCGRRLKRLKIETFSKVDVLFIGENCQRLILLSLINNSYHNVERIQQYNLYQNLLELKIMLLLDHEIAELFNLDLLESSLFAMLLSPYLRKIMVVCQTYFSDELIIKLLTRGSLKNLEFLHVYECNHITDVTLWASVINLPKIRKLEVGLTNTISKDNFENIATFIKNHNYKISFSMVDKLPYILRWLVINLPTEKTYMYVADDFGYNLEKLFGRL